MRNPVAADDLAEIERRVVLPVVHALLRDGELDELRLRMDAPEDEWPWPEPGSVWLWFSARGEIYWHQLVPGLDSREGTHEGVGDEDDSDSVEADDWDRWDGNLENAETMAAVLYDDLRDWLCETQLSWGVLRDGDYNIPPPPAGA